MVRMRHRGLEDLTHSVVQCKNIWITYSNISTQTYQLCCISSKRWHFLTPWPLNFVPQQQMLDTYVTKHNTLAHSDTLALNRVMTSPAQQYAAHLCVRPSLIFCAWLLAEVSKRITSITLLILQLGLCIIRCICSQRVTKREGDKEKKREESMRERKGTT